MKDFEISVQMSNPDFPGDVHRCGAESERRERGDSEILGEMVGAVVISLAPHMANGFSFRAFNASFCETLEMHAETIQKILERHDE